MQLDRYKPRTMHDYKPARKKENVRRDYFATFGAVLGLVFVGLMLALSLLGVQ